MQMGAAEHLHLKQRQKMLHLHFRQFSPKEADILSLVGAQIARQQA
jgi:hypothetical protein